MANISDHAELIRELGGAAKVSADLSERMGEPILPVTVRAWPIRNRIPPEYWPGIIGIAEAKGFAIDADWLMRTTPARKRPEPQPESAAA